MKPSATGSLLLGCVAVDIGAGHSYHRQFSIFVVLVVPSSYEFESPTHSQKNYLTFSRLKNWSKAILYLMSRLYRKSIYCAGGLVCHRFQPFHVGFCFKMVQAWLAIALVLAMVVLWQ
jgi:hypothetical protein